jgi:lathosterol oxidase
MTLGLSALFYVILGTTIWMYAIEKHGPYYGYYETHEFGVKEFFCSLFA